MSQSVIQTSFNSGEWSPALNSRVDLQKYKSGAALMRNFFVDYRGGASTRPGTKYVLQAKISNKPVRIISFQPTTTVSYVLEFGDFYIRFYSNGSAITETAKAVTGASKANPAQLTVVAHGYVVGDWVFVSGIVGMTQLNGRYFQVKTVVDANNFTIMDLNGVNIDSTGYTTWTSGGTTARVYTITTQYAAADLALLKFSQNVNTMIITHPSYLPAVLTLNTAANWVLSTIIFGSTVAIPSGLNFATTLVAGSVYYAYLVTALDGNYQESGPSAPKAVGPYTDIRTVAGSNTLTWTAVTGASAYNVYRATLSYGATVPNGASYAYVGTSYSTTFIDSNNVVDYAITPPLVAVPATGSPVGFVTLTASGTYTVVPAVTFSNPPAGGSAATGYAALSATNVALSVGGFGFAVNDTVTFFGGVVIKVTGVAFSTITTFTVTNAGSTIVNPPANPLAQTATSGSGTSASVNITWGVGSITLFTGGSGYLTAPTVTFAPAGATATATLSGGGISGGGSSAPIFGGGNPGVSAFFNQRLVLAGSSTALQSFYMSQPGSYYNFNTTNPAQPNNAISGNLVSGQLNQIKALVTVPQGLLIFSNKAAWLLNGGSPGAGVSATGQIVANTHAYNGISDVPPVVATNDILYVQDKGSIVRNLSYNFYSQVYTGTDITVLSSHLFYSYSIKEWSWAEEPFKVVWAVRNDGQLLSLTFLKEQELMGWAHSDTNGLFTSTTSVTETVASGRVDAVYFVVQRIVNGNTVQYIERMADRVYPAGVNSAWCVDCGLQYSGAPANSFQGAEFLAGMTVTGLADGVVIPPFTMPVTGFFTIPTPASTVTIGLAFTAQLQTLQLDIGEPTVQGKRKKIAGVTVRVKDTLGLSIGRSFTSLVAMKDLVVGNVGTMTNQAVAGLITGDARTIIDPLWDVPGQYCIQQSSPLPATIEGVIPEIVVGDAVNAQTYGKFGG